MHPPALPHLREIMLFLVAAGIVVPLLSRLRSLVLLGLGGLAVLATTVLTTLGSAAEAVFDPVTACAAPCWRRFRAIPPEQPEHDHVATVLFLVR